MSVADYPDFTTPQAHATAIAATGVPLLSAPAVLVTSIGQVVAASATETFANEALTQPGYAIELVISYPAAATIPYCEVRLTWTDPVSGIVYGEQHYIVVGGTPAAPMTTLGSGPARSAQLTVAVTNLDPAQAATVTMLLAQDSVIRQADRWGWRNAANASGIVPGFTLPTLPDDESCLGLIDNLNIPASTTVTRLFGMWPGLIAGAYQMNAGVASSLVINIRPQPDGRYAGHSILFSTATPPATFQIPGPNAPLRVDFQNLATSAIAVSAALFAVR